MRKLFIMAGCNGAGKTTASYTMLPEMLDCREFVNADEIAKGLSPFNQERMAIEAGRIMLQRMEDLLSQDEDFAFETTLASRSYTQFIEKAHAKNYFVTLLFFWLPSPELAIERVATRVAEGGHNIPEDVIRSRYDSGIRNFKALYMPACDFWTIYDNSGTEEVKRIAWGTGNEVKEILEPEAYAKIMKL